ncbi:MAG: PEGA domain-containing protein, partial [Candidatus Zixiibacteriota bacterium]
MDRNKNHFTLFVFIIISISKLSVNAQSLGEMDARLVEKTTFINRNPNVSILVVHSVIAKLQFESNMGIIRVDNSGPGEYVLHLGSETNIITIKAESYLPFKTDHIYIKKKQAKELQVTIVKKPESMSIAVGDIGKGIVIITSNPEKATVYWDGNKLADKTPVTLTDQPAFTHSVRLELGEQ